MNPIITQAPTMANPEAFNTVQELREELHSANATILKMSEQLHSLCCITQDISERLARLVLAHLGDDQAAVKRELDEIVSRYVKIVQKPQGGVH